MPSDFQIQLDSNAAQLAAQQRAFPAAMLQAIARALDYENELTVGHIAADKLSQRGPTTLGVRTNRLRSSVRPQKAIISGGAVLSAIGSNVVYAAAHEYGFTGTVQVPQHTRRRSSLGAVSKQVSAVFNPKTGKITKGRPAASGPITVRAHPMKMNIRARAPIFTGITDRADNYSRAVSAAVLTAWNGQGGTP